MSRCSTVAAMTGAIGRFVFAAACTGSVLLQATSVETAADNSKTFSRGRLVLYPMVHTPACFADVLPILDPAARWGCDGNHWWLCGEKRTHTPAHLRRHSGSPPCIDAEARLSSNPSEDSDDEYPQGGISDSSSRPFLVMP